MSTLIKNGWILTMDDDSTVYANGYLWISADRIAEVGQDPERQDELSREADEVIDAAGKIVIPGLINAHTHLFQTFTRGLADDKPLLDWLREEIWPFSLKMEEEDFYLAALIGCVENLKTGATSVIDQHYIHTTKGTSDRVFSAMQQSGIRGSLCRCFANIEYHPDLREEKEVILGELERLYREWHGKADGRLTLSVGPLNPWGCSPDLLVESAEFARGHGLKYQVHTAETRSVVERTVEKYGKRNVAFFHELGVLGPDTQLVHAVWLDDTEIDMVKDSGAMIVHCPVANMYLASGVAPVPKYLENDIIVALATDGPGSNNSQDMVAVLKFTACLHKVSTLNSTVLYPEDVLAMATAGGAKAMGREDLGKLAKGMKADIVIVDWKKPHIAPVHRPVSALVYNANGNDVDTVLVDGKVVVKNGKAVLVDEEALIAECQGRIKAIRKALGRD
ncbi:amidohydrolase family protein [Zhaonella formicivorans]|uniref:amidohydrolase family protein n=1 Tax=Zhaonella formicivorans TaxID=2528593 RepID=UPI001D0F90B7|nr:amidohydrolase [Zhaonella formicivorans]